MLAVLSIQANPLKWVVWLVTLKLISWKQYKTFRGKWLQKISTGCLLSVQSGGICHFRFLEPCILWYNSKKKHGTSYCGNFQDVQADHYISFYPAILCGVFKTDE